MLQPAGSIIELCHVVTDMDRALDYWWLIAGAGPFFIADLEISEGVVYRGGPGVFSAQVAFGFSGGLLIELIKPLRDVPSVFREVLERRGPGYHHVMPRLDYATGHQRMLNAGYEPAFHGRMPSGERYVLFDTTKENEGFVELMEMSPLIERQLENMAAAHASWDGHTRPIRTMGESFS